MVIETEGAVLALLAIIATIDLAQFAVTVEHRGRIAKVEAHVTPAEENP